MISNHIFVFFYNLSVFMGLLSMGLAFTYRLRIKDKNIVPRPLLAMMLSFFLYGFTNLLAYYNLSILINFETSVLLPVAANLLYIFMYFFWIRFLAVYVSSLNSKKFRTILYLIVIACCVLWTADHIWFMDIRFNVLVFNGTLISLLMDILFYIIVIYSVILGVKNWELFPAIHQKLFILIQSVVLSIYFSYMLIKDFRITFANYTVDLWYENNIGLCAIFSFVINTCFIIYFFLRIKERFIVIDEFEVIVHNKNAKIDQIALEYSLSGRETDVLRLIFEGKSNQEISDNLFISTNTVKKHINALLKKMNLHNRVDIITKYK